MTAAHGFLEAILARKRREIVRRQAHRRNRGEPVVLDAGMLRRAAGSPPHVVAEIKFRSPSAGELRPRRVGDVSSLAQGYARAGASVISVLADGPGFGGCVLDVRRVARTVTAPVLFKEFVLDECQIALAREAGASLVLLLCAALEDARLGELVAATRSFGMTPVVEAATAEELDRALGSGADVVGINARDLRSFKVDPARASDLVERIPLTHVAVYMSGVRSLEELRRLAAGRADAVLVGEMLMRASSPERVLADLIRGIAS